MISKHVELAADGLLARKLLLAIALLFEELSSHFGCTHTRVEPIGSEACVGLTLTIYHVSDVGEQVGQVRLRRLAPRRASAPVDAFNPTPQFMQALAHRRTIPAQLLLRAVGYSLEDVLDRASHEQSPGVPLERPSRLLK